MPDVDHDHQEYLIVDLIEDPVVPDSDAPRLLSSQFLAASGPRVTGQGVDGRQDVAPDRLVQAGDRLGGAAGDLDAVGYA